jgi:hypothetical protein
VDRRDFAATVGDGVFEGEAGDPLRGGPSDDLDALRSVRADHVLDAGVKVLGVLANDDEIHVLVAGPQTGDRPDRPEIRVKAKRLAQSHVDGPEALADRCRDGSLDGDLVAQDRVEDVLRKRGPLLRHHRLSGFDDLPIELDTGGVEDPPGCLGQLGADAVSRNERHCLGHGENSSRMVTRTAGGLAMVRGPAPGDPRQGGPSPSRGAEIRS